MRHIVIIGRTLVVAGALLALAAPGLLRAQDPVDDLRQALPIRLTDLSNPSPAVFQYRQETLQKRIDALKTLSDLRRALALEEWKEDSDRIGNEKFRLIDADARRQVAKRFVDRVRQVIANGEPNARLALSNMIAEMGPTVRSIDPADRGGFAKSLTPEVIQLAQDKDLAVRQEGLRALGSINAPAKLTTPVLVKILQNPGEKVGPRRLAADGLGQVMRVVMHLQKRGRTSAGVEANREDLLSTALEVIKAASAGARDGDAQVRASCARALQLAAQSLADLVPDGFPRKEFPPQGRPLGEEEKKDLQFKHERLQAELEELANHLTALKNQGNFLASAMQDPDPQVRLAGLQALESVAAARLRLKRRAQSLPALTAGKEPVDKSLLAQWADLDPLGTFLPKGLELIVPVLSDADVGLRRAAIDFLEVLEESAAPAVPALTAALDDVDRFVRWSATRALAAIPAERASGAVPQLARLLADPDLNVRLAAASALEGFGSHAHKAAPQVALAVGEGDPESRIAAMYIVWRLGADGAKAVPQLAANLKFHDPRVRRLAAETLGKVGPSAHGAVPALRQALGDDDQETRVQASDALLSILERRP